jgi:hypothetical protein
MTLQEAKTKVLADGSLEIRPGVYLLSGQQVLDETKDEREAMETDRVSEGYSADDIDITEIYCQTNDGHFASPTDSEIVAMLAEAE